RERLHPLPIGSDSPRPYRRRERRSPSLLPGDEARARGPRSRPRAAGTAPPGRWPSSLPPAGAVGKGERDAEVLLPLLANAAARLGRGAERSRGNSADHLARLDVV